MQKDFFDSIGQSRKSVRLNGMSVLPPTADVVGPPRQVLLCHHRKSVDFSITSSVHSSLHFGLNGLLQKRSRAVAQDLGHRVRKALRGKRLQCCGYSLCRHA
jgi:hypothetical protein